MGGGKKIPGKLEKAIESDLGGYDKMRTDFVQGRRHAVWLRLGLDRRQGWQSLPS